jgi:hypothetical protein
MGTPAETTAPAEGAAAADEQKADEKQAAEQKRPWWRRFSTPAVATLLGIVLSAWLLPAITRQWDDQRKVHELKTSLVTEMTAATAHALTAARSSIFRARYVERRDHLGINTGPVPTAVTDWSIASTRVDAKLRAYLSASVLNDWRAYSLLMTDVLDRVYAEEGSVEPESLPSLGSRIEGLRSYKAVRVALKRLERRQSDFYAQRRNKTGWRRFFAASRVGEKYRILKRQLLLVQAEVANEVLDAHLAGYSTSARDLLRDLVPYY